MRRFLSLLLVLVFFAFFPTDAAADAGDRPVLRVGYTDVPGYISKGEDGYFRGFLYDYLEAIAVYSGYRFEYVQGMPLECMEKMRQGELDLIAALPELERRPTDLIAAHHAITYSPVGIIVRRGKSLDPGQNLRIGYTSFIYSGEEILSSLRSYGLKEGVDFSLVPFDNPFEMHSQYRSEKLDAYIESAVFHNSQDPMLARLFTKRFSIIIRADHEALRETIDRAVENLFLINPHIRGHLYANHTYRGAPLLLTPDEKKYLKEHPVISAAAGSRQKPYTYFENGEAKGVIAEIMHLMEKDLGVRFDIRETENYGELMQFLAAGDIEVVTDCYADYNWGHMHNALLTFPYLTVDYVPVMRKGRDMPEKPIVACAQNQFHTYAHIERNYPKEQILYLDTIDECMNAVNQGKADITFVKSITVQHNIEQGNYLNLFTNGIIAFSHNVCMAISDDVDPCLVRILNKEITHLGNAPIDEIMTRQMFEVEQNKSLKAYIAKNPLESLSVVALLLLSIIGGLVYLVYLRQRSANEAYAIAHQNQQTGLPNVRWFEEKAPIVVKKHEKDRKEGKLFVMVLSTQRIDLLKASLDPKSVANGIRELVKLVRAKNPWILIDGISSELTHLYLLGRLEEGMTLRGAAEKFAADTAILTGQGYDVHMHYDFGLCSVPTTEDIPSIPALMANADTAQREAMERGDYIGIYDEKLQQKRLKQKMISQLMQKALANEEFQIWLQPKYDIRTHKIIGAETLTRWQSPDLGFVMPGLFIDVFERTGFILEFDYHVLETVCRLQKRRIEEGKPVISLSVNQSGMHIREPHYLDRLREIFDRYQLPAGAIDLEITETAFVDFDTQDGKENSSTIITAIKEMGCTVSMDDFCTGYSSIAMLQHLDMDVMKIDRAMLLASESSVRGEKIMRRVVSLGQDLDMLVLCEGVETKEQEEFLLKNGCFYAQGFLFGRPMPAEEFFVFADKKMESESA